MRRDYWIIFSLGLLFFVPFLGAVHLFDWDEINFAECAREMLVTGDYLRPQIDFQPFWEKPPLFIWMQAASMHLFGVNEFAARFPNALAGIATLLTVFYFGSRLHDRMFAWIWSLAFLGSILPHLYFRSGIIDPWFNLFIFISISGFIAFRWQFFERPQPEGWWARYRYLILGGGSLGLAVMTKGPAAVLIAFLTLLGYWAFRKFKSKCFFTHLVLYGLSALAVGAIWFAVEVAVHGWWFVETFVTYQIRLFTTPDAGHGGFWGYHVVVLLLGSFPASAFALPNLWGDNQEEDEVNDSCALSLCKRSDFATWMQILFWVVLILFSIVKTKIVHYSSMAYFPLTYLGALTIWRAIHWGIRPKITPILLGVLGVLIGLAVAAAPWLGARPEMLQDWAQNDPFAVQNLTAHVDWAIWQGWPGWVLIASVAMGLVFWSRHKIWEAAQVIFAGGAIFTSFTLINFIEKVECYSQHSAIEFYEKQAERQCKVSPLGFKSYAHLFYGRKRPDSLGAAVCPGEYFVAKCTYHLSAQEQSELHELYHKNGFHFYEKIIPSR